MPVVALDNAALALVAGGHMRELPAANDPIHHSPEGTFMADPFIAQASRRLMPEAQPTNYYLRVLCTDIDPNLTNHVIDQDNFLTPGAVVIEQLQLAYELSDDDKKLAWAGPFRIIHFAATIIFQEHPHAPDHGAARFVESVRLAALAMLHDDKGRAILAIWCGRFAEDRVHKMARWLAAAIEHFGRGSSQYLEAHRREPSREELVHRLENLCGMLREALQAATVELAAHAERIAALTPAAR
ncbi:hypothetical protein Rhopal_001747-T1 [Rhodotorula paludigena]|uniref:Uncharacterized protein n=1 Tax=Rhodotorula paludigena TaxID=86838 RepID=A0AAV5GJA6_9BASI|nr:hypothetical protein Rhopal_001747-T1 [Rhodotorula paludigena]